MQVLKIFELDIIFKLKTVMVSLFAPDDLQVTNP